MAKRGSARRSRGNPDMADDDFAWQSPSSSKKKKRKSTKSKKAGSVRASGKTSSGKMKTSGKRRRSGSSANVRASSSSRTKGGSGRRSGRRGSSSGEDVGGSARRRRAPPVKKKGVDPVIPISIISGTVLICICLYLFMGSGGTVVVRNEENMYAAAQQLRTEGMDAFRAWGKARRDGDSALEQSKYKEALKKLQGFMKAMDDILEPHRDPASGFVQKEYEGYEAELSEVAPYIIDLEKSGRLR